MFPTSEPLPRVAAAVELPLKNLFVLKVEKLAE
jgi:hypothetical protein